MNSIVRFSEVSVPNESIAHEKHVCVYNRDDLIEGCRRYWEAESLKSMNAAISCVLVLKNRFPGVCRPIAIVCYVASVFSTIESGLVVLF
jgi:hypothetical protein